MAGLIASISTLTFPIHMAILPVKDDRGRTVFAGKRYWGEAIMATKASAYERQLVHEIKNTPEEYLPNLLQIVRLFRESVALNPAEASFRQGWKEAQEGKTLPVSRLWEGIDGE